MSSESAFEDFKLENSILCKHRKIAARVETVFCEAPPIRLNHISPLKRLGPGCCTVCNQYNCICLWDKHITVQSFKSKENSNSSQSKSATENSMLYKLKKRNFYCGNMHSRQMQCVMRPVPKMFFSESDDNSGLFKEMKSKKSFRKSKLKSIELGHIGLKVSKPFLRSKFHAKYDRTIKKEAQNTTKEYLNEREIILDETLVKSNQKPTIVKSQACPTPVKVSMLNPKKSSTMNDDCMTTAIQITVNHTQPTTTQLDCKRNKNPEAITKDYAQHIHDIINDRYVITHQNNWINNDPCSFNYQPNGMVREQTKATEFLKKEHENENPPFARSIESLENVQRAANKAKKRAKEQVISAVEYKNHCLWTSPSLIETLNDDSHHVTINNPPNSMSRIYQNLYPKPSPMKSDFRIKTMECDEKTYSNVAIQTEQSQSMTFNQSRPEKSEIDLERNIIFPIREDSSIIEPKDLPIENNLEKCPKQKFKSNSESVLKNEAFKGFTKVKSMAALFEAEIQANIAKAREYDLKFRSKAGAQNSGNIKQSSQINSNIKLPPSSPCSCETNTIKSKDSGILSDQIMTKMMTKEQLKCCESCSNCSLITIVSKE